jgi:hypothetical protein
MSNTSSFQPLVGLLEKRPLPNKFGQVHLGISKVQPDVDANAVDSSVSNDNTEDDSIDTIDENDNGGENPIVEKKPTLMVVDKRRTSMLDRLAVLKRLQTNTSGNLMIVDESVSSSVVDETPLESFSVVDETPLESSTPSIAPVITKKVIRPSKPTAKPIIETNQEDDEIEPVVLPELEVEKTVKPRKLKIQGRKEPNEEDVVDLTTAVIRTQKVIDRLPKEREKVIVKAPSYYMNNRKIFVQKISETFAPYQEELRDATSTISCDTQAAGTDFDLLTHQKIVRDYLNLYTPYRGLLLYHGLGSGKTCTSIAIAEGMKSDKRVFIMTPASLKMNFFSEMKKCGDELYKKNQYWEFVSTIGNPNYVGILSRALSLPSQYVTEHQGAWLVNINKEPNYTKMSVNEQKQLDEQLNAMIRNKYTDINYNGLNERKMKDLTGDYSRNPFDNSVIIIDEAHNFVSRIVNKLKAPESISYKLYEYLLSAQNAKVVLLTGTPIINYPNEISILYNILRGYIKTWTIPVSWSKTEKLNENTILTMLDNANLKTYDYIHFSDNKLVITRNPYGFINTKKRGSLKGTKKANIKYKGGSQNTRRNYHGGNSEVFDRYNGVKLDDAGNITDNQFLSSVLRILKSDRNGVTVKDAMIEEVNNRALPDDKDIFFNSFIDVDDGHAKNMNLFQRRILGLTSYFRSAQEELLPEFVETEEGDTYHVVKTVMTPHQFSIYEKIRKEEADREKKSTKRKQMMTGKADELYNVSSTYRIFSRAACNFTFPLGIERPIPGIKRIAEGEEDIDENALDNIEVDENEEPRANTAVDRPIDDTYNRRIESVMEEVSRNKDGTTTSEYLSKEALPDYSPKFAKILENVLDTENQGLHLLYSHFRTIEGIGIMRLILLANGMAEFKLKRVGDEWALDIAEEDMEKSKFVLYTGTETAEEKEIIRNVYNGTWSLVPQPIVTEMSKYAENNIYGDVIKMIMITSSGAEGINLRNTRFVHIVEPYWHMVRVEQVVGRARRICSHQDLPEDLRTVKVFLYVSTLSEEQKNDEKNVELRIRDISRVDKKTPVTTDETLYEIASSKQRINNELLRAIKESAVDCNIYSGMKQGANTDPHVCYGYGLVESNNYSSYPSFNIDTNVKDGLDVKTINWKGVKKTVNGVQYALNPKTNQLYDLDSFKRAQKGEGQPVYIGKYELQNGRALIV